MQKFIHTYFVSIILACTAMAQDNFVPGHIITTNGDSIAGMINDQYWSASPSSIQFRNNGLKTYEPKELLQFGVGEKALYKSFVIEYDSTSESRTVSRSMQPTYKQAHVFLRVVLLSNPSLLEYKEDQTSHYFVQFGNEVTELINHTYEREVNGAMNKFVNRQYIEQLRIVFKGCDQVSVTESTNYSEKEIATLFQSYYQCRAFSSKTYDREKVKASVGIVGTVGFDQMRKNYSGGIGFGGGILFSFNFPNKLYKSAVNTEILFRKFGDQSKEERINGSLQTTELELTSIKVSVLYSTRLDKLSRNVYLETGFTYSFGLEDKLTRRGNLVDNQAKEMWAFVIGTGVRLSDELRLSLRYEIGSGVEFKNAGIFADASGHRSLAALLIFQL